MPAPEKIELGFFDRGPGPAGYDLPPLIGIKNHAPTHKINPAYSIRPRYASLFDTKYKSPGPAQYNIKPGVKAKGRYRAPEYTMRKKLEIKDDETVAPGPIYFPDVKRYNPPAHSFGIRHPVLDGTKTPGPNAYGLHPQIGPSIPDRIAGPEITIKGRRPAKDIGSSPGPIYYPKIPDKPVGKTIGLKLNTKNKGIEPGPASYEIGECKCKVKPGWVMGIKHSDYAGILFTPCDKSSFGNLDPY